MAGNDLRIKITGTLNVGSTIGEINSALKGIEKKINKLKINVNINDKAIADFTKQMQKITQIASNSGKVIESAIMPDGTKVTRTFFDGMNKGFQQTIDDAKRVKSEMKQVTGESDKQLKSVKELTANYSKLANEAKKYNKDGTLKSTTSTHLNDKGNARVIKSDNQGNVINFKDIDNFAKFEAEQNKLRKGLQELARTGQYTTEQLRKIGQGISFATTVKQLDQMKLKMSNLKMSDSLKSEQDRLRDSLTKVYNQGQVNEKFFKNFNKVINGASNVKEIQKVEQALKRVTSTVDNKALQQSLTGKAETLLRTHSKTVDTRGLKELIANLKQVPPSSKSASNSLKQMEARLQGFSNQSKEAARSSMGMMTAFKTAMVKYPVWMAATTLFIGIPRLVHNAISTIVELDSKLVSLQKVMSDETNFASIMNNANESAKEFGKTLSETLDTYIEFSRQGYKENEIPILADAALVTSNVGEMDAGKAAEYLTSSLVQLKLEAKDAMGIVDAWNNVSNNNATTVEKLAQGYARAASVARVWNMDMHELNAVIGTVTAATKQSGNEVGNFLKNALPRLTSKPAKSALDMVGVSLTDESGNLKSALQIYKEVSKEFVKLDKINQSIVAEGLAGKYHIARMTALLTNMEMVDKIYTDSKNSANSARIENDKYMDSLEARINKTKQSFEQLALSVGDAFLTETFIEFLEAMKGLAELGSKVADSVGVLPVIFGTVSAAALMMSKSFRVAVTDMSVARAGAVGLGVAFRGLAFSMKALIASTGVGLLFAGIGFGIERLLSSTAKARQQLEEFERKNKEMAYSFKENQEAITELADRYEKYDQLIKNGDYKLNDLKQYNHIKNELAKLMPSLVVGEDQYGNKVLMSSDYIKAKTKLLEQQLATQERIDANEQKEKAKDDYDIAIGNLDKLNKEQGKSVSELNTVLMNAGFKSEAVFKTIGDVKKRIEELNAKKTSGDFSKNDELLLGALNGTVEEYDKVKLLAEDAKTAMKSASIATIDAMLKADEQMSTSTKSMANDFSMFVATSEADTKTIDSILKSFKDRLSTDIGFKNAFQEYGSAIDEYREKLSSGLSGAELETYKNKAKNAFDSVKESLLSIAENSGLPEKSLNVLSAQLDSSANSSLNLKDAIEMMAKETGKSSEEILAEIALTSDLSDLQEQLGLSLDGTSGAYGRNTDEKFENISATSLLLGITEDQIAQMENAIMIVSMLSGQENLNAQQKAMLADATGFLASMYPHLNGQISENIGWIQSQIGMMSSLNQASGGNAAVMMANQDSITKASVAAVNQRIMAYQTEIAALRRTYDAAIRMANDFEQATGEVTPFKAGIISVRNRLSDAQLGLARANDTKLKAIYGSGVKSGAIKPYDGSGKSSGSKGSKDSGSDREVEQYLTDKYAQAVDALNTKLEESEYRSSKLDKTSKEYRKELNSQISIQNQLRKLASDEQKRLESRNATLNRSLKSMGNYNKLSDSQKEKYNDIASEIDDNIGKINDLKSAYVNANRAIDSALDSMKEAYNEVADEVISVYKETYEKQRDLAIDALDKEIEAFEKAHNDKMDMLQEELSAYEKIIQAQIDAIDKEEDDNGYDKELAKKQKEQQDIVNKMNILALDDSVEARNRYAELEKQLAEKNLEIEEFVHNREVQLRKDSLNQQLEDRREYIENIKELEDQAYEKGKEEYDAERDAVNRYWENVLNDERYWAKIRSDILKGSISAIELDMLNFSIAINEHMKTIGESISLNLIDKIRQAKGMLGGIAGSPAPVSASSSGSIAQMATGGMTPKWSGSDGKLAVLHQEELLLNKGETRSFFKSVDILEGITNMFQKFAKPINLPSLKQPSVPNQVHISMPMTIENLHATKDGGNEFMKTINKGFKELGMNFNV